MTETMIETIEAWHFLPSNLKLGYGDNREVKVGETLTVDTPLELCKSGLHASFTIRDAMLYQSGPICCKVEIGLDGKQNENKIVSSFRKVIWMKDCTRILHDFSCLCAERTLKQNNITNPILWKAIEVKRLWLDGKATDAELDKAREDADAAAVRATYSAAVRAAYSDAAYAAAYAVAYAAVRAAAAAARAAARADTARADTAGRHDEIKWQNEILEKMILE